MNRWPQTSRGSVNGLLDALRPHVTVAWLTALAAAPLLAVAAVVPPQIVLPTVTLLTFAACALAALYAWRAHVPARSATVTAWDLAGALALIGCVAATLSEPSSVIQFMEITTDTQ